jgi:sugar/nucleoside kinase (ribokinase family)
MRQARSDTPTLDVLSVGEAMVLFAAGQPGPLDQVEHYRRLTAGAELNVAIGLARLGLRSGFAGALGQDSFGRHIAAVLQHEGVDTRQLQFDGQHATGFMLKSRSDDASDPRTEYFRRGSAASRLRPSEALRQHCAAARHLHLTGIYVAVSDSARELVFDLAVGARAAGRSLSFDPNLRPALWPSQAEMVDTLNALARHADWVLPGLDEGRLLTGQHSAEGIADFYLERGARCVVVKLGAQGAYYASAAARGQAPGWPVERVVDTVGAGDGFAVGVLSGLLEGLPLAQAAARGNAIGARVVQFPGDCDGLPTRAELNTLLGGGAPG